MNACLAGDLPRPLCLAGPADPPAQGAVPRRLAGARPSSPWPTSASAPRRCRLPLAAVRRAGARRGARGHARGRADLTMAVAQADRREPPRAVRLLPRGDASRPASSLTGTEVKSLRNGRANIAESYAAVEGDEIVLINAYIPEYAQANRFNHEPRRPRKLLLHRKQIDKLIGAVQREGRTLIPTAPLLQRQGPGEARARPGQGQEGPRQARGRRRARLEARQGPADARQGLRSGRRSRAIDNDLSIAATNAGA